MSTRHENHGEAALYKKNQQSHWDLRNRVFYTQSNRAYELLEENLCVFLGKNFLRKDIYFTILPVALC